MTGRYSPQRLRRDAHHLGVFDGHGRPDVSAPVENGNFGERNPRAFLVKHLLPTFGRRADDLDAAAQDEKDALGLMSLCEQHPTTRQFLELTQSCESDPVRIRKASEIRNLPYPLLDPRQTMVVPAARDAHEGYLATVVGSPVRCSRIW